MNDLLERMCSESPYVDDELHDSYQIQKTMLHEVHYATVSEALNKLRAQGFEIDFNLKENAVVCAGGIFSPDEFEIVDVYRYEGDTDPADEATVYAIQSKTGLRGVLVTGYGATAGLSGDVIHKLSIS